MEKTVMFSVDCSPEVLRQALATGQLPSELSAGLAPLIKFLAEEFSLASKAIYLCSADDEKESRDLFAYLLALALGRHAPGTVLVDCDFLQVGLSGVVPQRDALGFLDMLLYGSSLGPVTQDVGGVKVLGAGSFPVTKRMPIAQEALQQALHYLMRRSRCVLLCGPELDEGGKAHPLAGEADIIVYVGGADRLGASAATERARRLLKGEGKTAVAVRLGAVVEGRVPSAVESPPAEVERAKEASGGTQEEGPSIGKEAAPWKEVQEGRANVVLPKVVTGLLAALLIAFLFWWLFLTRNVREEGGPIVAVTEGDTSASGSAGAGTTVGSAPLDTATEREAEGGGRGGAGAGSGEVPTAPILVPQREQPVPAESVSVARKQTLPAASTSARAAPEEKGIAQVVKSFDQWRGKYLIHISSFRELDRARNEAAFLDGKGFPVHIVEVNLSEKGKWFRVYAGPWLTRDEAREMKIELDAIPRVKFTRITQVR